MQLLGDVVNLINLLMLERSTSHSSLKGEGIAQKIPKQIVWNYIELQLIIGSQLIYIFNKRK